MIVLSWSKPAHVRPIQPHFKPWQKSIPLLPFFIIVTRKKTLALPGLSLTALPLATLSDQVGQGKTSHPSLGANRRTTGADEDQTNRPLLTLTTSPQSCGCSGVLTRTQFLRQWQWRIFTGICGTIMGRIGRVHRRGWAEPLTNIERKVWSVHS